MYEPFKHAYKCEEVQIHTNDSNKPKFIYEDVAEQIKFRDCVLPYGSESFVFQSRIWNLKEYYIQNYNTAYSLLAGCETCPST
jgi:hypothetical protein